jgi:hypothetical protein
MLQYKRNQVEEAISNLLERSPEPTTELRTRIKRLLELDRGTGGVAPSDKSDLPRYAFYSADAPGSGTENWFSGYEAFALFTALRLMAHGWRLSFAVRVLRHVRPKLEKEHARTLAQDPVSLFDWEAIKRKARPGDVAFDNTDPVLLTIVSKSGATVSEQEEPFACAVRRGLESATKFVSDCRVHTAGAWTMFELVRSVHDLSKALTLTKPRRRGRAK